MKLLLSTNIKEFRKSHNLTQEQLAEAMNVTVGTVSKWESASSSPDIEMIVELADFFHISVDVLLGYQWKSTSAGKCVEYLNTLRNEHQYEKAVAEARKALKQYPNHFEIVYECGEILYHSAMEKANFVNLDQKDEIVSQLLSAVEVLEKAISLFDQNTDRNISKEVIYQEIGSIYGFLGEKQKAIAYLEKHNVFDFNDRMISIFLLELNQYDKAWEYITSVCRHRIFDIWQSYWPIYNILINTKKYDEALSISEWMNQLCISVAGVKSSYYHRAAAITETLIATVYAYKSIREKKDYTQQIHDYLKKAFASAAKFDREPDYFGKICFFPDTLENVHDSFGETAALAVKNTVLCSKDDQEEFELLREHYDDIVSKSNNKELMIKRESEK